MLLSEQNEEESPEKEDEEDEVDLETEAMSQAHSPKIPTHPPPFFFGR